MERTHELVTIKTHLRVSTRLLRRYCYYYRDKRERKTSRDKSAEDNVIAPPV